MIDNNIIQSLGAGSGIDTTNLVSQLSDIERQAPQERIDSKIIEAETQISDYGIFQNALATLQDAASLLASDEALNSKSASYTESDALVPSSLSTDVQTGVYNIKVLEIAQSQALAFDAFDSQTESVGEGTLTINFGAWARDGSDIATTFSQNAELESITVDITSANDSLLGLAEAINEKDAGVQASVIFDGSGYRLSLLTDSGEASQVEIVATEAGDAPTNTDDTGLSRFAFNASIAGFENKESQLGRDALLDVNGLEITRSSNAIDDIVDGLSLDILKAAPDETVTITVTDDVDFAKTSVETFINAYNDFFASIESAFGTTEQEDEDGETETVVGSLTNDALTKSIISQIRGLIGSAVPGLEDSQFSSLTNIGIRTELDGSLSINDDEFDRGFDENFEDVKKLFGAFSSSSDQGVSVNSFGNNTTAGQYDVVVDTQPSQGFYTGQDISDLLSFPLDTTGTDYSFTLSIDGTESNTITLPENTYNSKEDIAEALQSLINGDENISGSNERVSVSYDSDNDNFLLTSSSFGANSQVNILNASTDFATDFGLSVASGSAGTTVSGTINGQTAFGSANVLLPEFGSDGEGLALVIGENATSASINFSRGFAGELEQLLGVFLESNGLIDQRESNLEQNIVSLEEDQDTLDTRIAAFEERLTSQFIAMESIINSLTTSGSFLDTLFDTLPFTSSDN